MTSLAWVVSLTGSSVRWETSREAAPEALRCGCLPLMRAGRRPQSQSPPSRASSALPMRMYAFRRAMQRLQCAPASSFVGSEPDEASCRRAKGAPTPFVPSGSRRRSAGASRKSGSRFFEPASSNTMNLRRFRDKLTGMLPRPMAQSTVARHRKTKTFCAPAMSVSQNHHSVSANRPFDIHIRSAGCLLLGRRASSVARPKTNGRTRSGHSPAWDREPRSGYFHSTFMTS
jgi:hypothetical protein